MGRETLDEIVNCYVYQMVSVSLKVNYFFDF